MSSALPDLSGDFYPKRRPFPGLAFFHEKFSLVVCLDYTPRETEPQPPSALFCAEPRTEDVLFRLHVDAFTGVLHVDQGRARPHADGKRDPA